MSGRTWLFASSLLLVPFACSEDATSRDQVLVGALLPFSGDESASAVNHERAILLAVDLINRAGGVSGKAVHLVSRDTGSSPEQAVDAGRDLIDRVGVEALIGPVSATSASATGWLTSARGVTQLLPSLLPRNYQPHTTLRLAPDIEHLACVLARRVAQDGVRRVEVLHVEGTAERLFAESFVNFYGQFGGRGASNLAYTPNQYSYRDTVSEAVNRLIEAVVLIGDPKSAAGVVQTWSAIGTRVRWYWGPFLDSEAFTANVPAGALEGSVGIAAGGGVDSGKQFARVFAQMWGGDVPLSSAYFYYDAMAALGLALHVRAASGTERDNALQELLREVTTPPGVAVAWHELDKGLELLDEGKDVNLGGVSGPLELRDNDFDEDKVAPLRQLRLWRRDAAAALAYEVIDEPTASLCATRSDFTE